MNLPTRRSILRGCRNFALVLTGAVLVVMVAFFSNLVVSTLEYKKLEETHDLAAVIDQLVLDYSQSHPETALSVLVYKQGNEYAASRGEFHAPEGRLPVDSQTLFEIGSISKVFTAIALMGLSADGKISLDSTLGEIFQGEDRTPIPAQLTSITLRELAIHRSGLPRLPDQFFQDIGDTNNPYAGYDAVRLLKAFRSSSFDPQKGYEYSNFGYALLGSAITQKTGTSYEAIMEKYIFGPLQMSDTQTYRGDGQRPAMPTGHDAWGNSAPYWDMASFTPAGGFISNADDLMRLIRANLSSETDRIHTTLRNSRAMVGERRAFAWSINQRKSGQKIFYHNGGTGGFSSFVGFDRKNQIGVIALANRGRGGWPSEIWNDPTDKLGMDLLKLAAKISFLP